MVSYRYKRGQNGRPRPWKGVLYDILMHPDTAHVFPEDGSFPEFKEEALRRFAAGTSILTPDKLEDIRVLLTREKFLKPKELEDDPEDIEEALALHQYLAISAGEGRASLASLLSTYQAERSCTGMKETFRLELNLDPSGDFVRVENIYEREVEQSHHDAELEAKDGYKSCRQHRRGFGFVCTNQNLLYLFTHGPVREDLVTYVQIPLDQSSAETDTAHFMVSGVEVPVIDLSLHPQVGNKEVVVNFNVLEFSQPLHEALLDELVNER